MANLRRQSLVIYFAWSEMMADTPKRATSIGIRLRAARQRAGFTQEGLAEASGCGLATIRRIEQGDMEPRADTARRLAKDLTIRAGWLMFGELPMEVGPGE